MSARARAALAAAALLVALLLATWTLSTPDTGGPVVPPRDPPLVAAAPTPSPAARATPRRPAPVERPAAVEERMFEPRVPMPWDPPPLDQEYRAEPAGLAEAAIARRDRFRDCWNAFLDRSGADGTLGRFTIQLMVERAEDGEVVVDATVMNEETDALLERCVSDSVADATFADPGKSAISLVWPVPIPTLPGEIP